MGYFLAQAGRDIPCYGTTHADYIYGAVPCARNLTEEELKDYERNTGVLIADLFEERKLDPVAVPVFCVKIMVLLPGEKMRQRQYTMQ